MPKFLVPNVPFVQARHTGQHQKPTAITLSLSCTTSDQGSALGIAQYHHKPSSPMKSWHYILDEADTYRCIPPNVSAYGNPYSSIAIHICAEPREHISMWDEPSACKVMHRAADLVADLCLAHKIRPRYISGEAEAKWSKRSRRRSRRRGGIIVRVIGSWPHEAFLGDVRARMLIKTSGMGPLPT